MDNKKRKFRIGNLVFISVICAVILVFSVSYFVKESKSFSEQENRSLQTFPSFKLKKLADGTYTEQLHNFYSDQILFRNGMIELKAYTELAMGKNENNSVIFAKDGYLIDKSEYNSANYEYLEKNIGKISAFSERLKENGIKSTISVVPRKIDVLHDKLPPYYSTERNDIVWNMLNNKNIIFLKSALSDGENTGGYVFYKTDHHWTQNGAYCAYAYLSEALGYTPLPIDEFMLSDVSNEFYGTTYSKSGFFSVSPDSIQIVNRSDNNNFATEIVDTGTVFDGFYNMSYLEKKDKYSIFINGNNAHVRVYDKTDTEKETLLLVKDSFSHALVPFLAQHYNLEIIDLRYYTSSLSDFIEKNNIENVLFIYGLDTLSASALNIR